MNYKKILLLCLMICFIFSMQAVSSAGIDLNDTLTTSDADVLTQSNGLSIQATPESNDVLGADEGSFSDLQNDIPATGTVELTRNYTYVDSDSALKDGIPLSGTITIKGNNVVIDASHNARVFNIASGANVTLQGITFINGNSDGNGGAITSQGILNVDNCNFINNTAAINGGAIHWAQGAHNGMVTDSEFKGNVANRSGGAIYWFGQNGTIQHSTFNNNKALGNVESIDSYGNLTYGGNGGAIMWVGSNGTVYDSTFTDNVANNHGGAVYLQGSSEGICSNNIFDTCTFISNIAGVNGGAIDWYHGAEDGALINTTFINNTAKRNGGAVYWNGLNGTIKNSRFVDNRATGENWQYTMPLTMADKVVIDADGSFTKGNIVVLQHSQLPSESSISSYVNKLVVLNYSSSANRLHFESYVAVANSSSPYGYSWKQLDEEDINVSDSIISPVDWAVDHYLGGDGGTIYWGGDVGFIYNCTFVDSNSARRGGAAYMTGSDNVTFDLCTFTNCTSGTNGGGVDWLAGANYGKIYNSVFNGTQAARSAGAIYYDGWYADMKNITIINTQSNGGTLKQSKDKRVNYAGWDSSHWDTNTTGGDAGAIMFTGSFINVCNVTFINATAAGRGGAVFLQDNHNVTFDLCTFIGNEALGIATNTWNDYTKERNDARADTKLDYKLTGHGGAIAFDIGAHDCTITNSEFNYNYARRDGGALNIAKNSSNFTVENSVFNNDTTGDDGGAINWEGDSGLIKNITCYNCIGVAFADPVTGASTSKGGTICLTGDNITITDSKFTLGGVLYNQGTLAETDAGGIFVTGENTTISNSEFIDCYSPNNAGAIKVIGNKTLMDNCTFINCTAAEDGGALYVEGLDCKLYNSTFRLNVAKDDGGAILWSGERGLISNSTFTNNNAVGKNGAHSSGGAINLVGDYSVVEKSKFDMATAVVNGGAIYASGNYINITDSTFSNCNVTHTYEKTYAHGGGAIYIEGHDTNIINSTFDQTNARVGGVIYVQGYDASIINSTTTNSYAVTGGAVYIDGQHASVINSSFNGTNAKTTSSFVTDNKGGAIYILGNYATIEGSNFTDASAYQGGILYLQGQYCNVINSSLDHGYSYHDGGAYYSTGTDSNVTGSNFTNNVARSDGGALFWLGSKYNYVIGCIFDNNTAYANPGHDTRGGGAIYFSQNGQYCGIKDSKFFNNSVQSSSKADGGAILWDKSSHIFIDGCLFDGNYVMSSDYLNPKTWIQGGVMYARPAENLTISNSVFQNCWSQKEAGALYLQNGGTIGIHLINNTFINNTAYGDKITNDNDLGGGAILIKSATIMSFINSSFINNTADFGGGVCINSVNDLTITNATFDGDKATFGGQDCGQGGGIWTRVKFTANNITFVNCEATNRGGGLYISNGADMPYTNLTFINNSAILGGGLYWSRSSVTIDGMSFINNSADLGGAIYIPTGGSGAQTPTSVINSNFSGNSANSGGAIYINNAGNIKISNNNFTYNTAVNDGGAIYTPYSTSANVDIGYSDFIGNNASHGGAIYSGAKGIDNWNIHDCNFTNNSAAASGGAIYVANVQFINNCMFDANTADGEGGAVYVTEGVTGAKIQDSTFTNSYASNGGAVYYGGTTTINSGLKIINCTFLKNLAVYNGGAVLYVTNNGINNYRDYNNFDGIGIPVEGGRTTVKTNGTNVEIISKSLFEDNEDYELLLRVISDRESPFIAVYLDSPRDWRTNKLRFVVNLTNATTHELISSVIVNASNYDTHYRDGMLYVSFSNLIINQTYNITASFEDLAHMYKENSTTARAHGEVMGEFKLLQKLIEDALERGDSELVLNRTFTFTPEIMGITENMDDRCINLTHIDRPFTIRGEGWLIDAAGYSRIFYITSPNVTIENVVLVGGNASGKYGNPMYHDGDIGGAIYWAGANGTLIDSHVEDNHANIGGGIYFNASAPNCKIINTVFEQNTAVTNGGAIDCNASRMELYNNTFRENSAHTGGALCREINSTNGRGVNNTFEDNNASYAGAGIAWINATHISIDGYKFYNNHAGYSGGALYVGEGSLNCEILNCIFADNAVDDDGDGHGGAIEWYSEKGTVYNSVFTNNHAYEGGAIYVGEGSGHINITKSTFTDNVAVTTGGAISIEASAVTINQSNFYNNTAKDGGAVYVGGNGTGNYVYSSVFEGNRAIGDENAMNGLGGAIDWGASSGTIVDTRFTDNCADYGGGVYFGVESEESTIINCTFERNQAKYDGGAIDCNASMMYIEGTLFDGNIAQFGAALCRETNAKTGAGKNNVFKNNHAIVAGAALGWMGSFGITITNYTFINNSADVAGGAIYVSVDSQNCSVNDCRFEDNYVTDKTDGWSGDGYFTWTAWDGTLMMYTTEWTGDPSKATTADVLPTVTKFYYNSTEQLDAALGTGGAMTIFGANATINNTNFTRNHARVGGGVYIGASSGNANIDYTEWRDNVATERGGALMIYASAVHVDDSKFYDNIAVNGSALYVGGEGTENKVHRTIFQGNNATGYGGAIYWVAYVGEIHNSEFTKNAAEYGGGIYFNGRSANTNLVNITFKSNSAVKNGGAIDCNASNIGIYNITFEENYAGEYGGALCREINATGGHGLNNTFIRNHAGISGAGLAWMGVKDIHIIDYHFIDNTAEKSGGAIFVDVGSDNDIIENCTFTGNHLTNMTEWHNGGAIDCRGKNLTIDHVDFTNNGAYTGGAIYVSSDSKNIHIYDSNFTENYAVGDGGALGLKAEALNINNTIFKSNTAGHDGGAVYAGGNGTNNTIRYSVFEDNSAGNHGGAIDWLASAGTFEYLNFTRNNAAYGGGIYLNGVSTNSSLNYLIFKENSATKNGGAIDCNATMMGLTNSQFISNHAGEYGAALAREENATGGYGRNNTFILNHADISGAALAWLGVDGVTINNYTFINNTAFSSGGAIYVRADSTNCTVYNSNFEDNYVIDVKNGQGGAIDWGGSNGLIENVTFTDSFAVNGGTIYAGQNSTNLTIFNTSFIGSRALGDGGAIALYGDNAKITYSNFTYTLALTSGGGISGHNANNATIDHCIFDYGMGAGYVDSTLKAYGEGGAIHWENSKDLNVSNSQFSNIRSNSNGGVISAINTNASNLYNLTFNQSYSSLNGGSISWINSTGLTFDLLKVEDSEAHTDGGAIYLIGINDTTIKNSVFNNTISPRGTGGSMYINGNATLINNTFDGYEAYKDQGDSLFLENGNITVADSSFNGKDAIWINHDATVYLNNNTITGPESNRDLYYLIDGYNQLISYAVWNDGNLYLLGDSNYDYIIINNGTIWTPTTTELLDNETYNVTWNENFTFWAHIYDDSKYENTIISVNSLNTTNDVYHDVAHSYILPYNCLTLNCTYQGSFKLAPSDVNLRQNTAYNGTLNVKMPVDLELIITNIDDYSVGVWAKLTPQAKSNFTIQGQNVTINVDGKEYVVNITVNEQFVNPFTTWTVGNASQFLERLNAGEYTATASYAGDTVHLGVENVTKTFYIQLHDIWIGLNVTDIFHGQTIILNVTSNATKNKEGYATIWINGKEVFNYIKLDENGSSLLYLDYDQYKDIITQPGTQAASIAFTNGSYYNYQLNFTSFVVKKYNTNITANVSTPIDVGSPLIVNVTVNETATGYVKLTINGKVHIEELHNGTATFEIYGLAAGDYINKTVEYGGDDWFSGNSTNITFVVVPKSDYVIDVIADNITYGNNATIRVLVPTDATGNVTFYVDGNIVENVTIVNGIAILNVVKPVGGEHVVNVTYDGDSKYSPKDKNGTKFMVNPNNTWDMTIVGDYKPYGENATFTIRNIPSDILGNNVTIKIDNVSYVVPINGGVATLTLNNLSAGQHSASVTYDGDANYINKTKKFFPDIPKATPTVTLIQNGTDVIALVTGNVTGNVTFSVNNVEYTVDLTSGRNATLIGKLRIGENYVLATYNGDENYTQANVMNVFNVDKLNTTITVTPTNITFGEDEIINVSVDPRATGFIAVTIDGKIYVESINDEGVATFNITGLAAKKYTDVRVTYYPTTTDFNANVTTTSFIVGPTTDYKLHVITDDIEYGQNATVRVIVDPSANGNVTIYVDGKPVGTVNITNGEAVLSNISGLAGGQHVVNVTYNGDSKFAPKENGTNFMVKPNTSWKVNITEVDYRPYGETSTINITNIPSDFTGENLTIKIDGIPYVVPIVDGKATLSLNNLSAGSHMATVNYGGDANYSAISQVFRPNIPQATPTVTLTEVNGDVVATVSGNTTGNVTFYVNGKEYTINLTSGRNATLTKDYLIIGNNSVVAIYNGDKNYTSARTVGNFTVDKISTDLTVVAAPETVYVGQNTTITVTMVNVTSGKVLIEINNYNYTVDINNGVAVLNVTLPVGNYTLKAYYLGNSTHKASNKSGNDFKVLDKITPVIEITVPSDVKVGQTVEIPVSSNGYNLTVWINGVKQTITDGKILYNVTEVGIYTIYANTTENDTHYSVERTEIFEAFKTNATLIISEIGTVYVGDEITIELTTNITDGEITIKVDDTVIGADGKFTPLIEGKYTITVVSKETGKYYEGFNSTVFNVIKRNSQINVTATGADVGNNATITVKTYDNATGYVTVNVNGTNYTIKLNNAGEGSLQIPGLGNGNYSVNVTYLGDDQYEPSTNSTSFEMTKVNTTMAISVSDITYGESANITVTITPGATGYITIRVNNTRNITLPIVEGKVNWIVSGLGANNYTVWANYSGDGKYNINNTDKVNNSFEVKKANPGLIFIVGGTVYENATVGIYIDDEIHGKVVNVTVDGVLYPNVSVDEGFKTQVLNEYKPYTIIVEYGGNENFTDARVEQEFTPSKVNTYGITVYGMNITVGDEEIITVEVPDHVDDVVIWVNGTKFRNTSFSGNKATFNITGLNLKEGIYTVTASVNDTEFEHINFTSMFTVNKTYPSINITIINETSIYVNDTVKVIVTVPSDVTEDVTIEINGMEFTNSTVNGNATFYVPGITYGNKTVVATYPGDDKYRFNSTTANFTVNKRQSQVNVTVDAGLVGDDVVINVTIPANATGYVIVSVDGTNYTVNTTNGNGSVSIKGLGNTTHTVHVTYIGDDQYLPSENSTTFGIPKDNTTISIAVESIDYGQKANITVTVKDDATGYITIKINDTHEITLPVVNGTVNWIVDGLAADNYTVYANYSGDGKYNVNATDKDFEVRQISPEIKIIRVISTAGENATIIVEIDPRTTENITVHVDKDYSVKPVNGIAVVTTDVLDYGNYTVNASYAGDKNFTKDYDIYKFTTNQTDDYLINITASDIEVGDNTNITVNVPSDATGKVIIELNGTNYTVTIADGKAVLNNVSTLEEGVYNVTAYFGDDKYANKTVETRFAVSKVDTPITITVVNDTSILVNDTVKVVVTVPSDVTEDVTIEIDGMEFTNSTVNGNATFYVPGITFGNKTVVATYPGDGKYRFNSTTAKFTVNKRQSQVNVTVDAGLVGDDVVINVTIPANAVGYVVVSVDGTDYSVNTTNGNGSVSIKGLGNTTHTVNVTYIGDDQYLPSENSTTFGIPKDNTTISISVESIDYGQKANITVTVKDDATGYITIRIDGIKEITLPVVNGTVNWIVDGLAADNYTVYANYSGDGKYNVNATDKDFEVRQISPEIEIISVISTADNNATIIVKVDPRVSDNITVTVDKDYSVKPVNGVAVVTTDVLDYGNYTVNASYAGDKNFTKDYDIYKFTTNQTGDYLINITASDIEVGDNTNITVNVPSDATGKVIIELNGTNYTVTIADGKAVLNNISTLEEGVYNVTAYFGDDKYANKTVETRFAVSKVDAPIAITVVNDTSILVNDTVKVVVTVPSDVTEDVTIEIDGMEFTNSTVNGNATFYVPGITYGNKTVVATYPGDGKYRFNSTTAKFTVNKRDSYDIKVNVTDVIDVGDVAQVNVTLPANANGQVVVKVDGQSYTINLTDGKGSVEIKGLLNGTYPVEVTYLGDDQYLSRSNNTKEIKVNKVPSTIIVTVDNITVGDVAAVNITVITNATGNVTIVIGDEFNKTVGIVGDINSVIVPGLTVGDKTVNVTYNGDDRFLPNGNSTTFTVGKTTAGINLIAQNITYGENETIIAFVNATGNVTFRIDGNDYATVNITDGKAVVTVPLGAGNYTVEAVYNGDNNTNSTSVQADFTVFKADPTISVEVEDITYGDVEHIIVHVNADGNVTIKVSGTGISETINLDNGKHDIVLRATQYGDEVNSSYEANATLNVFNLPAGKYTVEVTYNGNDNFNKATVEDKFLVDKADVTMDLDVLPSIPVGETQVINITISNTNATGSVTINLDGKNYTKELINGSANFTTPKLASGNHSVVVIYEGDGNFTGDWASATFEVTKLTPEIGLNVTLDGDTAIINVTAPEDATQPMFVDVNGVRYYVNLTDGKGQLTLTNLTGGDYVVEARYPGDDNYTESGVESDSFKISDLPSNVTVKVDNITYGDVAVVEVSVPDDATGNVTVTIDGKPYEANVSGGKAVVVVPGLEAGNHTVDVTYNGDEKYAPSTSSTELEVSKVQTDDIKVFDQGNGTVVVVVPDNATGNVTIKVGNNTYNATVENGVATITLDNETPGTHEIEVIYSGDKNHSGANTTSNVTIPKVETPISVDVHDINVGDSAEITVNVPDNATGNVTIEIDGVKYTEEIKDGKAIFNVDNLTAGTKTIAVDYPGDDTYLGYHTTANITVSKLTPEIILDATLNADTLIINVTAPEDATQPVLVDVDDVGYYVNVTDGKGQLILSNLTAGNHTVVARYLGDDKYNESNPKYVTVEVSDIPSNVTVKVDNITYGDVAVVEVSVPDDATGNVTVTIDGKPYEANVSGGKAVVVVPGLEAGNHTVDVTYNGDEKYAPSTSSTELEVSKANGTDFKVIDQGNGTIAVVVGDNATGNITIKVGDNNYTAEIINGTAVIDLVNETPGVHDIEGIYSGDNNHEASTTNATVTIPKLETPISVEVSDIKVGDTAEIVVTVPDDAKGNVTIEIDGVKYTEEIKDGKATFNVENLTAGTKTIAVDYAGDNNYTGNHTTANFTVNKRNSTVDAETSPIDVGETAVITITVPDNATGYAIVELNNQTYAVEVENGIGTLEVSGLPSGTHDINVKYLGDDQYLPSNSTATIKVSKVPSTINVTAENITVGDKAVITVEVPEDLCGNVTVSVDGKNYTVFVSGGHGTLVIPDLEAGEYTVDAIFDGCKKYEPSNATTKFKVSKAETDDIKVIDQQNGTITIVVGDNATGNVTVKVGDETYTVPVVDGVATVDLANNTPGTYDIEVIYSGDDKHSNATATSTVTVPKVDTTPISVEVSDIKVGDTAEIVVNVPEDATGDVTIEIDGEKYTAPIVDGRATFNIDGLDAGNKTIAVEYVGDDKYVGNHTTAKITVSKRESEVSATITDSNVGDNVTVTVTVPDDATGQVLVDIDGVGYYVNVTDGTGTVEIPRIPSGIYNVTVTYTGDDKYMPSSNTTTFNVNKVESFVIPQAQDIYVGDNEKIIFLVPEDATGTVTVIIDGVEYDFDLDEDELSVSDDTDKSYAVAVSYGKGKLVVSGLPRGEYIVSARYNGDDKYLSSTNTTTFRVLKKSPIMDVTDLGNGTVVVNLPEDATGNVTIKVGDNTYAAPVVDGKAVIDLTDETPGTHDIEVSYSGDDKYNPDVEDSTATIPKYDTSISVEVDDINVGDTAVVTVTLPDDATGTVTIEINGKEYTAEVKGGKAVFNVEGLEAGNKTVAVRYDGDDNYASNSTTAQFIVSKVSSTIEASGKDITVGNDEVITVILPSDATGRVLVEIDGVGYYGTAINGKAKIIIPELPSGDYTVTVNYEGDDKYLPSSTAASFKVTKSDDPISVTGDEITVGEDATVVVTLPEDATGNVTIVVDGKEYTTDVVDGKAVFTIPDLPVGRYTVDVYYSGDKKYDANSTTTEIIVHDGSSEGGNESTVEPVAAEVTLHATGNPIWVLLLVLFVIGSTQLRRFRK